MATKQKPAPKKKNEEVENPQTITTVDKCEITTGSVTHVLPKGYKFALNEDETKYIAEETDAITLPLLSELEEAQQELFK